MPDVEMKPASKPSGSDAAAAPPPPPIPELLLTLLRHNLALVHRSVLHLEARFAIRALRNLPTARKRISQHPDVLARIITEAVPVDDALQKQLLAFLPQPYVPTSSSSSASETTETNKEQDAMDVDAKPDSAKNKTSSSPPDLSAKPSPEAQDEINAYLRLLVIVWLIDHRKASDALTLARESVSIAIAANRRTLDQILSKTVFYLARAVELTAGSQGMESERANLLALHLTASLRHDSETTATIINLLLRSYIVQGNLYDQADKLVARAPFPRAQAGNFNIARYEYWVGRIRAVQLNYTEAHTHLQQAIRRGPQPQAARNDADKEAVDKSSNLAAAGFLQTAYKFLVVVELLMGDIPERSVFRMDVLKKALTPYLEIVQAVRVGDLQLFQTCLNKYTTLFQKDATYSLILRLRHNVIKTGIRMISLSYSRISLLDITRKLGLESEEDAEYIVAKAIRDGVIEAAKVDHEKGWMISEERKNVYSTEEPRKMFETRIEWCLGLRNESVKAMRYSLNSSRSEEMEKAEKARERQRKTAKQIADGEISDDEEGDWI
ncbi:unnamed protein product [Sympodiomycopsis kandeliae]